MKEKHIEKINREINETIIPIMNDWSIFNEDDMQRLLKKFGNICRDETSVFRKKILSEEKLLDSLLEIGNKYKDNTHILIEIVSSIHNMHDRYGMRISDKAFEFLLTHTKNRKVNFYISIFITQLPQFEFYKDKWEYIMSIPNIAPREKSISTFYNIINKNIDNLPTKYKPDIVAYFEKVISKYTLHISNIEKYQELIKNYLRLLFRRLCNMDIYTYLQCQMSGIYDIGNGSKLIKSSVTRSR